MAFYRSVLLNAAVNISGVGLFVLVSLFITSDSTKETACTIFLTKNKIIV